MRTSTSARERFVSVLFLLACFLFGVGALTKGWLEFVALQSDGVTIQGLVVDRDASAKGDRQITYHYEAPGPDGVMQTHEFTKFVTRDFFTLPGEPISVVYLPDRPQISNLAGNRFLLIGDIVWATILLGIVET